MDHGRRIKWWCSRCSDLIDTDKTPIRKVDGSWWHSGEEGMWVPICGPVTQYKGSKIRNLRNLAETGVGQHG